jgi:hypothetical protein
VGRCKALQISNRIYGLLLLSPSSVVGPNQSCKVYFFFLLFDVNRDFFHQPMSLLKVGTVKLRHLIIGKEKTASKTVGCYATHK